MRDNGVLNQLPDADVGTPVVVTVAAYGGSVKQLGAKSVREN